MQKWTKTKPDLMKYSEETLMIKGPGFTDLAKAVTEKGKKFRFMARGFSMSPFIKDGDLITVSPLKERRLKKGDIVAFYDPDKNHKLCVHRIISIKNDVYQIKGDNLHTSDGFFSQDKILGMISEASREGKKIIFGIHAGKKMIALFSRGGFLAPSLFAVRRIIRIFRRGRYVGR